MQLRIIASLFCREGKLTIKSNAGAIKCSKEKKLLPRLMSGVTFHCYIMNRWDQNNGQVQYLSHMELSISVVSLAHLAGVLSTD